MIDLEVLKQRRGIVFTGAFVAVCAALWLLLYEPLLAKIKAKGVQCAQLEGQAREVRGVAVSSWRGPKKIRLTPENGISSVLDEVTRKGRGHQIDFISITPGPSEKPEGSPSRITPVALQTRSSYKALGIFLGQLGDMESAFLTVRRLEVRTDSSDSARVLSNITLYIHLSD